MREICFIVLFLISPLLRGQEPLTRIPNCTLVATEWADGDSFAVLLPDGKQQTVRLYGADCIEIHVSGDQSNANRLREQRRHFGIDEILVAKAIGEQAKVETFKLLGKPFTVYSSFAAAGGDGRFSRVYAFIETQDGKDLSEWLISQGLARAFGVIRQLPDGTRAAEWKEELADLQLTAARAGKGAWAKTNWENLPKIRKEARDENSELELARGNQKADESQKIDPNTAARDQLMTIPGVGEKTAAAIIESRPYVTLADLLKVEGIGPASLKKFEPFLAIQKPNP